MMNNMREDGQNKGTHDEESSTVSLKGISSGRNEKKMYTENVYFNQRTPRTRKC